MSRTGNPYENAHMESFFKTLKYEEVHLSNYETYHNVIQRISSRRCITANDCILLWGIYPGRVRNGNSTDRNGRSGLPQFSMKSLQSAGRSPPLCKRTAKGPRGWSTRRSRNRYRQRRNCHLKQCGTGVRQASSGAATASGGDRGAAQVQISIGLQGS